ncbi:hypothetical protein EV363DRAFT_1400742 [Boletus edulis]|nr:hypothetical protein EV363DRAFT_1400742 [Boletus edulis]
MVVFNNAAKIYGIGDTFLTRFDMDPYSHLRQDNIFYPFADLADWRMANYLLTSKSSMSTLDKLLSLATAKKMPLSFWTAKELHSRAEILLSGPCWNSRIVPTTHPTKEHVVLYFRDALNYIELLFNHPFFADKMDYTLFHLFTTAEQIVRVFTEWMSSESTWEMQISATLCGVILSSDKTNISNVCGSRVAHPLQISLANIKMSVRNKGSSHAFLLLALMPIAQFTHPKSRMCSVLDACLFHQCLDIVLRPLKEAARIGKMMSDPIGNLRYCFTPLMSYIVDMPEADVDRYFTACEVFRLSGVSHPFWSLHHWYGEFWDHDVCWCIEALGSAEIDFRFSILPHITGLRRFSKGITKLKQVGGQTKQEVQRYIVVIIASAADPDVVIAIRALMEFQYLAQAPAITSVTCDRIHAALQAFHDHKAAIIKGGLRRGQQSKAVLEHWQILKLELLQSVAPSIKQVGSLLQWSADTTEHAHIEVVKDPASMTNNQNYDVQICRCLDRYEKCGLFDTAIALRTAHEPVDSQERELDDDDIEDDERADEEEGNVLEDIWAPKCQQADLFKIAARLSAAPANSVPRLLHTFVAGSTAIRLNYKPLLRRVPIDTVAEMFKLPDLRVALGDYVNRGGNITQSFHTFGHQRQSPPGVQLPFKELDVWYKVRLQQKDYYDPSITACTFTVHAQPPDDSASLKYGRYDAAIINTNEQWKWPSSGLQGHNVIIVHLIMCPTSYRRSTNPFSGCPLMYSQRLNIIAQGNNLVEHTTGLHVLKKAERTSGCPLADIFPLDQIRSYAHIVPHFGRKVDNQFTSSNCIEHSHSFFLNKYFDKDFYYALSTD